MARFEVVVAPPLLDTIDKELNISGPEGHHLARVRRIRPGAHATIKDGLGKAFSAQVISVQGETVRFHIIEQIPCPDDTLPLCLIPAIIKGKRMDWLIQKACELGVREIRPVITHRTVVRYGNDRQRIRRWRDISVQALKQCSGNRLTEIQPPVSLDELLDNVKGLFKIMLWEGKEERSMFSQLQDRVSQRSMGILIGPEGGFTPDEVSACLNSGFLACTLGSRVLRTETAAIAAAAQVAAACQSRFRSGGKLA